MNEDELKRIEELIEKHLYSHNQTIHYKIDLQIDSLKKDNGCVGNINNQVIELKSRMDAIEVIVNKLACRIENFISDMVKNIEDFREDVNEQINRMDSKWTDFKYWLIGTVGVSLMVGFAGLVVALFFQSDKFEKIEERILKSQETIIEFTIKQRIRDSLTINELEKWKH
jgi:hypothetical protein